MGATNFLQKRSGKTAREAFSNAVTDAQYDYGHAGYTGTIAEKSSFVMISVPADYQEGPIAYAEQLTFGRDPRIDDKWGPAGCIDLGGGEYLFFGWASS